MRVPGPFGLEIPNPWILSVCSAGDPNCVAPIPIYTGVDLINEIWILRFLFGATSFARNASPQVWAWAGGQRIPAHGLWTHGNWCGAGGAGYPVDQHDTNCMTHDYCYSTNGLTPGDNFKRLPPQKLAALQSRNQALCSSERELGGPTALQIRGYFTVVPRNGGACR